MSMSTHVVGFRPPDKKWEKMKAIYKACREAGVDVPDKVHDFFGDASPDGPGAEVDLDYKEYSADGVEGIEINVSKIPKDIEIIRFYNSW